MRLAFGAVLNLHRAISKRVAGDGFLAIDHYDGLIKSYSKPFSADNSAGTMPSLSVAHTAPSRRNSDAPAPEMPALAGERKVLDSAADTRRVDRRTQAQRIFRAVRL